MVAGPAAPQTDVAIPRWFPNLISSVRIVLVPVWVAVAERCRVDVMSGGSGESMRLLAFAVLVTIGVSDLADGYLARRFGLESRVGATLDAFADKFAQVTLLVWLSARGEPAFHPVPWTFTALVLGRDVALGVGYLVLRMRRGAVRVVHRTHGKLASVLVFGLVAWVIADLGAAWIGPATWVIAAVIAASTLLYVRDGIAQLGAAPARPNG